MVYSIYTNIKEVKKKQKLKKEVPAGIEPLAFSNKVGLSSTSLHPHYHKIINFALDLFKFWKWREGINLYSYT